MNWYRLEINEVFKLLGTDRNGLSSNIADELLLQIGPNELKASRKNSILAMVLKQFEDLIILILLFAAIVSGIIGDFADTIIILIIVVLNACIGFFQEYRAEKAMEALKQVSVTQSRVIRNGKSTMVPITMLVPGDMLILEAGNEVPADLRIIESINLKIEEAALTGESNAVDKITDPLKIDGLPIGDRCNMAFKGTFVVYGRGMGVVIATGMQTELGFIAAMLQESETLTPLQMRVTFLGKRLSILVLILGLIFFTVEWLRGEDLIKMLLTSISLAVAAIPEALPAVITIALSLAAKKMIKFNVLIKKLPAVETLGSVNYICTDKTGTLTRNKMNVEIIFVNSKLYKRSDLYTIRQDTNVDLLLHSFALNNDVGLDFRENTKQDSTEVALMEVAREHHIDTEQWPRLAEIPFDAVRKLMTTFHRHKDKIISFTKGAPEFLLSRCMDIDQKRMISEVDAMGAMGHRVLGFAYRLWNELPDKMDQDIQERDLHFLGFTGIIDPPREEVFAAITECKSAGIVPVMITGDHPLTAKNIALRIGIFEKDDDLMITGKELTELDEDSFLAKVHKIKVYARVSPEQKLSIVEMLQKKGYYVAMTGDGINDAPALRRANIGVAMGLSGTDVSKAAADMILLDDNFSTIVKAVREGRRVYDNILKFIKYLMTTNLSELLVLLLGPVIGMPIAFLPIHILWINLMSDGLPAISLSFEKEERAIMNRPPRLPQESIFDHGRGVHMVWIGLLMAGVTLAMQAWAIKTGLHWQTIVFNVLSLSQMGHLLAIRFEYQSFFSLGTFSNKPLIWSVLIVLVLQFAITYTPIFQSIFQTEALSLKEFIIVAGASSIVFIAVEIEKAILRMRKAKNK
ncbi:cation-translocating P-type ATPase [Pedobacter gandavensis]|uniref:cation-translocating P-type ATPase n=1 Tax=Pedobacter gandavensis TaxID=2679963 RepID=UPI0024788EDE|nr:cation-translocating P-type ATPase [Pedobacter gandavensis]WGQ10632.1 cation-translocating P-type ATPase [Pedobacter gandavensis]